MYILHNCNIDITITIIITITITIIIIITISGKCTIHFYSHSKKIEMRIIHYVLLITHIISIKLRSVHPRLYIQYTHIVIVE